MVAITINLSPPLSGVLGSLYLVTGEIYNKIFDLPLTENGVIDADITTGYPELDYIILFPGPTVDGVSYMDAETPLFNLLSAHTFNITLVPVEVPNGNGGGELMTIAIPAFAGIILMFALIKG